MPPYGSSARYRITKSPPSTTGRRQLVSDRNGSPAPKEEDGVGGGMQEDSGDEIKVQPRRNNTVGNRIEEDEGDEIVVTRPARLSTIRSSPAPSSSVRFTRRSTARSSAARPSAASSSNPSSSTPRRRRRAPDAVRSSAPRSAANTDTSARTEWLKRLRKRAGEAPELEGTNTSTAVPEAANADAPESEETHAHASVSEATNTVVPEAEDCGICLDNLHNGEKLVSLAPCAHFMHDGCFKQYQSSASSGTVRFHCPKCTIPVTGELVRLDD